MECEEEGRAVSKIFLSFFLSLGARAKGKANREEERGDFKDFSDRVSRLKALGFHEGGKSSSTWVSPD